MNEQATEKLKDAAKQKIDSIATSMIEISHKIFAEPELAYQERKSSALLADSLEAQGLKVERGAHGLETAFRTSLGKGSRHVVICAEYDALPEIGHACGHNIIGTSSIAAGISLAPLVDDLDLRVTVLGTPAEEAGGGKQDLIKAGAFDGVDAALMVHPAPYEVVDIPTLAVSQLDITYHGKESHASAEPHLGRNALDALNISYTAISMLRQHIRPSDRIHGIVTHGGDAPNIVPKLTKARYYIRAKSLEDLVWLKERVMRCFEAGALASGCELEVQWAGHDYAEVITNKSFGDIYDQNLVAVGRRAIGPEGVGAGSTDMGNVSKIIPSIHPLMSIDSHPHVNHQAEFAQHTVSPAGDKAIVDAATTMAWTIIDLATVPDAFEKIRSDFESTG